MMIRCGAVHLMIGTVEFTEPNAHYTQNPQTRPYLTGGIISLGILLLVGRGATLCFADDNDIRSRQLTTRTNA